MLEGIEIRAARDSDLTGVHALEVAAFPSPWRREFFEGELRTPGRFSLVALRGGKLIAYVFAMWVLEEMHINKIAVAAAERRLGIAEELMARCFEFARQRGIQTITLEVRQSNRGAQDFYRHLSFDASYVRSRYYPDGEAAVVMTRRV